MATIQQLRQTIDIINPLVEVTAQRAIKLRNIIKEVKYMISESNPYAEVLFPTDDKVTAFQDVQTQRYIDALRLLEQATDALGSDILN